MNSELAVDRLKKSGARMTAQRRAVIKLLSGNQSHPTAESIIAQVREKLGCVAPATIYNTLDALEEMGFLRRIEGLEQCAHFDPDISDHHHVICSKCRKVWDIDAFDLPDGIPEGFKVIDVLIQGKCADCAGI